MASFSINLDNDMTIRFQCYVEDAPVTSTAFLSFMPLAKMFSPVLVTGLALWFDDRPPVDLIQEDASLFPKPGDVVSGPSIPSRPLRGRCFRIGSGACKGLD